MIATVGGPPLILTIKPSIFYFRAWEYYRDIVKTSDVGLTWDGYERGDQSRDNLIFYQNSWKTHVSVDSLGLRSTPIRSDNYPMLIHGDSLTFGSGLSDDETVPWRLSKSLAIPVLNSSPGHLSNALSHPNMQKPKIVIEMLTEASIALNLRSSFDPETWKPGPYKPERRVVNSRLLLAFHIPSARYRLADIIRLDFQRFNNDIALFRTLGGPPPRIRLYPIKHLPGELAAAVEAIKARSAWFQNRGVQYRFICVPAKQSIYGPPAGYGIEPDDLDFASRLSAAVSAAGLPTVDLLAEFRQHGQEELYFATDTHWTARATELAASAILRELGDGIKLALDSK